MAIDVGSAATDRSSTTYINGYTNIPKANPVNADGIITIVELWAATDMTGLKVGTFSGSGSSWDDRDYETIGSVPSGSKQVCTGLSITAVTGDLLGCVNTAGNIEIDKTGGKGHFWVTGDKFGAGASTYTSAPEATTFSLYGTGISASTVTTQEESDVTSTSMTGNGNITDTGGSGSDVTRRGFCYVATTYSLEEYCADLTTNSWSHNGNGTATASGGKFNLDSGKSSIPDTHCALSKSITGIPDQFTVELNLTCTTLDTEASWNNFTLCIRESGWVAYVRFASGGLYVRNAAGKDAKAGSITLDTSNHTWTFCFDKTSYSTATVTVYKDGVSQGTFDCDYEANWGNGITLYQYGHTTDNRQASIDWVHIMPTSQWLPDTGDSTAYDDGTFGTGAFTKSITGLTADTSYRIRAYAVNAAGTAYGTTVQAKTQTIQAGSFLQGIICHHFIPPFIGGF